MTKSYETKKGRNPAPRQSEHFTKCLRHTMETPAWRALTPNAQALYPWLKLEWRGQAANNNGKIRLSTRQAAIKMGVTVDTAAKAFRDLQAKGFLHVSTPARLGVGGEAKSPSYEITELAMPSTGKAEPRKLYLKWSEGHDFPVFRHCANNPTGRNGKKPCHKNHDSTVIEIMTARRKPS
jgi:hypothetical protein